MNRNTLAMLLAFWLGAMGVAGAQTLEQEMSGLAGKIGKSLASQGFKSVAAIDFTDLQGQPTELGRFLSEELAVEIVSTGGVSMVDRANIKSILAEHKLTEEGLVDPANAKKLGEFAGVDAILIGNVTALDDGVVLMVKAIATSSAQIVAAGKIKFPKTSEMQQLLNRGISGSTAIASSRASGTGGESGTTYQAANAIATKDLGPLRVVLKSVMQVKGRDPMGRSVNAIRCSFEFISRETQRTIVVALNAKPALNAWRRWGDGEALRASLVDERGTEWGLPTSGVIGVSFVTVGPSDSGSAANPAEIASLLQRQEETGTNIARHREPGRSGMDYDYQFVFGSTTPILPGQSQTVVMTFVQDAREGISGLTPRSFQLSIEIVVGVGSANRTKSYSLQSLIFDRIDLSTER
jgi:hypothetical protein